MSTFANMGAPISIEMTTPSGDVQVFRGMVDTIDVTQEPLLGRYNDPIGVARMDVKVKMRGELCGGTFRTPVGRITFPRLKVLRPEICPDCLEEH